MWAKVGLTGDPGGGSPVWVSQGPCARPLQGQPEESRRTRQRAQLRPAEGSEGPGRARQSEEMPFADTNELVYKANELIYLIANKGPSSQSFGFFQHSCMDVRVEL